MLTFDQDTHEYRWNGQVVPSVTQILSRVGTRDQADGLFQSLSGAEYMNSPIAANFGTQFHRYVALELDERQVQYDAAMEPWIHQWRRFMAEYDDIEPIAIDSFPQIIEEPIYCQRHGYAMTPDWAAMFHGKPICVDWKTGESMCPHWWLQGAAYVEGLKNFTKLRGWEFWVVQIGADRYRVHRRKANDLRRDMNRFQSALNVYKMAA